LQSTRSASVGIYDFGSKRVGIPTPYCLSYRAYRIRECGAGAGYGAHGWRACTGSSSKRRYDRSHHYRQSYRDRPTASVRLIGSCEWRRGKVRQVLGSAAGTDNRLLVAQIPHATSSSIAVEVELAQDDSDADRNSFCNVGRMAEVRFQRTGLGFADRILKALPWLTGGKDIRQAAINNSGRE
jgi:hypothetical protein